MASIDQDLNINAWRLKDNNGYLIADQTSGTITGSFGDYVRLEIDFQTGSLGVGENLRRVQANFGLFVPETCLYPNFGQSLSVGWQYIIPTPVFATEYPMCFIPQSLTPTQLNQQAYFEQISADEFTISLEFWFTADLNGYMSETELENIKRLLYSLFSSEDQGVNEAKSVYSIAKAIGLYVYVETDNSPTPNIFWNTTTLSTSLDFVNEGSMINQTYAYERAGQSVSTVSSVEDTTIIFSAENAAGAVNHAKLWVIGFDRFTDEQPFYDDGSSYVVSGTPVNTGGNTWETQYVLTAANVNADESFYFLFVYYDETNNVTSSFISPVVQSIGYQDTPALETADITSSLSNYNQSFGNYIDSVPYHRLRASVAIDKTAYDADVLEGDFDTNFQSINIDFVIGGETQETITIQSDATSQDSRIENIVNNASTLSWDLVFRPNADWISQTLSIEYEFVFLQGSETTIYQYLQKVDVVETDDTDISPKITSFVITDTLGNEITNFCLDQQQVFKTESTTNEDGRNHFMIVVPSDTGNFNEDQEYVSPVGLTQLDQAGVSNNNDVYTAFQAGSEIDLSQTGQLSQVIVISLPNLPTCAQIQEEGDYKINEASEYMAHEAC